MLSLVLVMVYSLQTQIKGVTLGVGVVVGVVVEVGVMVGVVVEVGVGLGSG
jgi:hypothetical protein